MSFVPLLRLKVGPYVEIVKVFPPFWSPPWVNIADFPNEIFNFGSLSYRGIIAGGGKIKQYMGPEVNYIITSGGYDKKNFQEAKNVNSQIVFLRPSFIKDCFDENKFLSPQKQHLITEN